MPVTILKISPEVIKIRKAYFVNKIIGISIISIPIIIFISLTLLDQHRFGKTISERIFCSLLLVLFGFILVREFYFMFIDRDRNIFKQGANVTINRATFLISEIFSIYIIEYNGIGIMENGFNIFLKLKSERKIPVSIRISRKDMEIVRQEIQHFLRIENIEKKRWWIS